MILRSVQKAIAVAILVFFFGGCALFISSGIGRRVAWEEVHHPSLYGGLALIAAALVLAIWMRIFVDRHWRADKLLGEGDDSALMIVGLIALVVGLIVGMVRMMF